MQVSIIIPAHNAQQTLPDTLESLLAQAWFDWRAIVVDDGSSDETPEIAAKYASRDRRIRTVSRPQGGEAAARNTGLELAQSEWALFLDADDWLLPTHLSRLTDILAEDPKVDAAVCGWARVTSDGRLSEERHCAQAHDVFDQSSRGCPFAIHACVVRRKLVTSVGGFDTTLVTCPDWDLWQRIARTGARFAAIPDVLAIYRMRPGSAGTAGRQVFADGFRVIERGHAPDGRVRHAAPEHANGRPPEHLPRAKFHFACWAAGLLIGAGKDAVELLEALRGERELAVDPSQVARMLFDTVPLPACRTAAEWAGIWDAHEVRLDRFLRALEEQSGAPGLAERSWRCLERLVADHAPPGRPVTVGKTHAVCVDITEPLPDVPVPAEVERLRCTVCVEGRDLGKLELPVCDRVVPAYVLSDAIAAEFAWPILGQFFERTLNKELEIRRERGGVSIWNRGDCLATGLSKDDASFWSQLHGQIGWSMLQRELAPAPFATPSKHAVATRPTEVQPVTCAELVYVADLCTELPDVTVAEDGLIVVPRLGGIALGAIRIPTEVGVVSGEAIRGAVWSECGFELCHVAVREAVLGLPLDASPTALRARLDIAAARTAQSGVDAPFSRNGRSCGKASRASNSGTPHLSLRSDEPAVLFGARIKEAIGTSASRRAMLPVAALPDLLQAACVAGDDVVQLSDNGEAPRRAVFAPELSNLSSRRVRLRTHTPFSQGTPEETRVTTHLPILMYHRIAPSGSEALQRYRVHPDAFEEQLRFLQEAGYCSIDLETWRIATRDKQGVPGRAIVLTFDDGYADFQTFAWPRLKRYGFSALVFLVADEIGGCNRWDRHHGEQVRLLGWEQIRHLQEEGVEFGSHSASHPPLSARSPADIVREGARSRAILERGLGRPTRAFAYPHGAEDQVVQHLIGACGYTFGLTCRPGPSGMWDPLLALPRIEIADTDSLPEFINKVHGSEGLASTSA